MKLDNVSMLNNFEFLGDTLKVWRAFDVGEGKKINISKLQGKRQNLKKLSEIVCLLPIENSKCLLLAECAVRSVIF